MKCPIAMLSRPQPAGESVARRLWWGQSIAPQIASNFGAGELTRLSSTYRIIYLHRFPVACSGAQSVWTAASPRRFSFHTTQSGEGSRRSIRCCVDAPHTHSEKAVNTAITLSDLSKES